MRVLTGWILPYSFCFFAASLKCALGKLASGTDEGLAGWILPYSFCFWAASLKFALGKLASGL